MKVQLARFLVAGALLASVGTVLGADEYDIRPNLGGWWRTFTTRTEGAEAGVVDLVMVGDSITQGWVDQVGRGVLKARFGDLKVGSLGVSGDNVENQLGTTMWGGLDGYKAKVVQVMIGTNNSGRNRPARTAEGIRRLLGVIREKQPQAKVILIPILPRGKADDKCRAENEQVNAIIRGYADGKDVIWKDFSGKWVDASGNCTTNLMYDLLHPNANGYEMWAKEVRPLVDRLRAEVGDLVFAGIPCVADKPVAPKTPAKVTEGAEVLFIGDDVHDIHRDVMHRDPWTPEYYRDYKTDIWNFNESTEVLHGRLVDGNRPYGLYVICAGRANVRLRDGAHEPPIDTYVGIKAMVQKIVADDPKARVLVLPPRTLPSDTPEQAARIAAVGHMLGFLPREVARAVTLPRDARAVKATLGCMLPNAPCGKRLADGAVRPKASAADAVRLMSFNIRHGAGMDNRFDLGRTAAAILREKPAFVGLQEIDQLTRRVGGTNTCEVLAKLTGLTATFARAIPFDGGEYGVAVLSREAPKNVKRIPLPGGEPRILLLCEFGDCWFGTTHLAVDSEKARTDSIAIIRQAVAACGTKPVFLTGDWNSLPDSSVLKGLKGFLSVLSREDQPTFNGKRNMCIDYVAVDAAHRASLAIRDRRVVADSMTSDHRPLLVEVAPLRTTEDWNDGWEFSRDGKTGFAPVAVPHDWAIAGPFDAEKGDPGTGKLPWKGVGFYRKNLVLEEIPKGRRLLLEFDGVMCDGTVFVNNQPCAHRTYGYLGMTADVTPYLFAGTNTVVVRADTTKLMSRWYPGAGLYRRVRKVETDDIYLDPRDVSVRTSKTSDRGFTVRVEGEVTSRRLKDAVVTLEVEIRDPDGRVVASGADPVRVVKACGKTPFRDIPCDMPDPRLWKLEDNAKLYTTVVRLCGEASDEISFRTGFRTFGFDAEKGFSLNGEHVQLKGVCLHSDLGILGMAFNRSAMRRQLRILKDMGVNAIRTSHNPPAPELLDLCDEMGLFVWDECFDKWNETCGRGDEPLDAFVEANLRDFVRRDRNHPCVFIWSIGNEIASGGGCPPGQEMWSMPLSLGTTPERCTRFRQAVLAEDGEGGRPVGIGSCFTNAVHRGDYANLDITGWNYSEKYKPMKAAYPGKPVIYSESASAFSEYGYYAERLPTNKTDYAFADLRIDSYDRNSADWSDIPDREFERMERDAYVCGEFVWTGMDYLGEPSPYAWRNCYGHEIAHRDLARSSYFGIFDLLGFPKDRAYLYRSYWNTRAFTLHIVPDHWTFPKRVGRTMPVYVYTSADEAELFVNGVSQGRRRKDPKATMADGYYAGLPRYRLMWDVVYQPGEVKAVAYGKDGKVLGAEILRTATEAASVVLTPESATLPDDPEELVFVKVTLADANGTPVPGDCRRIGFRIEGPGEIVSVGNGNPRGFDSFKATSSHPLDNGRAGLVVRRTGRGKVVLTASADGLASGSVSFY